MPRPSKRTWQRVFTGDQSLHPALRMLGWESTTEAKPAGLRPHRHVGCWEICYIVHGRVDWWAGREMHRVSAGHAYLTRPDEAHGGLDATLHPCELYWAVLKLPPRGALPGATLAQTRRLAASLRTMRARTFAVSPDLPRAFAQLIDEHRNPDPHSPLIVQNLLLHMLAKILRDHDAWMTNRRLRKEVDDPAVAAALHTIEADLVATPTLKALAQASGLTGATLRRRFLDTVGLTPADYLTLRRLDQALHLLRSSDLSITRIALEVGFSSSQYFATALRKRTGLAPSAYRRLRRG